MRIEVPVFPQTAFTERAALDLRGRSRHGAPDRKIMGGPRFRSAPQEDQQLKHILKLDRLRLEGPNGARDEFTLAATAQNLRKMAKLIPMPALRHT